MLPIIAIVGRPNVGKSTLFNTLTKTRDALVADWPGVTRDRQYGLARREDRQFWIVDTGGLSEPDDKDMAMCTDQQVHQAMAEADKILFMVDVKQGLTAPDRDIAQMLRTEYAHKVVLVANKADRDSAEIAAADFYELGIGDLTTISASSGRGVVGMINKVLLEFPPADEQDAIDEAGPKIAVVGRPNVGKSTLINRLLGEDRVIVYDQAGTTRDSIMVPYERRGKHYTLIDTAGVRRRTKVHEPIEKISVIKTLQAIEMAQIAIVVLDAREVVTDQDLHLLGKVMELGKGLVIAFNKWDDMDDYDREQFQKAVERKCEFVNFARRYFISALHGTGVGNLYHAIDEAYEAVKTVISTPDLTKALEVAQKEHQPPLVSGRRVKLRYAHMGGHDPLIVVIHGKQVDNLPGSYKRYLVNFLRTRFKIAAIPIHLRFKNDDNPYV